jgi:hypothetical protein
MGQIGEKGGISGANESIIISERHGSGIYNSILKPLENRDLRKETMRGTNKSVTLVLYLDSLLRSGA